eukprot:837934-Amphidinium_carterae.2
MHAAGNLTKDLGIDLALRLTLSDMGPAERSKLSFGVCAWCIELAQQLVHFTQAAKGSSDRVDLTSMLACL